MKRVEKPQFFIRLEASTLGAIGFRVGSVLIGSDPLFEGFMIPVLPTELFA